MTVLQAEALREYIKFEIALQIACNKPSADRQMKKDVELSRRAGDSWTDFINLLHEPDWDQYK